MNLPVQQPETCQAVELLQKYQSAYSEMVSLWLEYQEHTIGLMEEFDATKEMLRVECRKSAEWMKISQSERAIVSTLRERNEALEQGLKLAHAAIRRYVPQGDRNPILKQISGYLQ